MDDSVNKQSADNGFLDVIGKSKDFMLLHPGKVSYVGELYSTPANSEIHTAQMMISTGKMRVSANNLRLGGSSNFLCTSSSLLSSFVLNMSLTIDDQTALPLGWGYYLIDQLLLSFQPSVVQQMNISGQSALQYALLSCATREQREEVLRAGGNYVAPSQSNTVVHASIPLSFILANNSPYSGFPFDSSTIQSITITITTHPITYVAYSQLANPLWTPTLPNEFTSLDLTITQADIIDSSAFGMKSHLMRDPGSVYTIPVKYITSDLQTINNYVPGSTRNIFINSFQNGICTDVLFSLMPNSWIYNPDTKVEKLIFSAPLNSLQLTYAGSVVYQFNTNEEFRAHNLQRYGNLNYNYKWSKYGPISATQGSSGSDVGDSGFLARVSENLIYPISLSFRSRQVISNNVSENLISYAGKSLNLSFSSASNYYFSLTRPFTTIPDVAVGNPLTGTLSLTPFQISAEASLPLPTEDYTLYITYINEAVLEISSNGTVRLVTE